MSSLFRLSIPDWLKGILMAFTGGALTVLYTAFQNGGVISWHSVYMGAAAAGISYIVQKFFTTSDGAAYGIKATIPAPPVDLTQPLA